jgi:hypothetical protein
MGRLVAPAYRNNSRSGLSVPAPVRNCALGRDDIECVAPAPAYSFVAGQPLSFAVKNALSPGTVARSL